MFEDEFKIAPNVTAITYYDLCDNIDIIRLTYNLHMQRKIPHGCMDNDAKNEVIQFTLDDLYKEIIKSLPSKHRGNDNYDIQQLLEMIRRQEYTIESLKKENNKIKTQNKHLTKYVCNLESRVTKE